MDGVDGPLGTSATWGPRRPKCQAKGTGMTKKRTANFFAGSFAIFALTATLVAGSANAANIQHQRMINLALSESMLTHKMTKELLLAALGVEKQRNLARLESSRSLFGRTLVGLQEGDVELGLIGSDNDEFLKGLDRVRQYWVLFDTTLRMTVKTGDVTKDQIGSVASLTPPMYDALEKSTKVLQEEGAKKRTANIISILEVAIGVAAEQRMLTQRMTEEFLLVSYGHEPKRNRKKLKATMERFQHNLNGLMDGDPEMHLVRAPTPEIRAQLQKVQRIWDELSPPLKKVADGGQADPASIGIAARMNLPLLKATNMAVFMYEAL